MLLEDVSQVETIDEPVKKWRQGDVVPASAIPSLHLADLERPLTAPAREVAANQTSGDHHIGVVRMDVDGLVLLTQTCDVVRSCAERPFVQFAVLEQVDGKTWDDVLALRAPRYALVPALMGDRRAANLDRLVTAEKALLARLGDGDRVTGCSTETERTAFATALARKHSRFAFPDDFNKASTKIVERIKKGHGRDSDRGRALLTLREIRIECAPDWATPDELTFLFLFDRDADIPQDAKTIIEQLMDDWVDIAPFVDPSFQIFGLDSVTAARYLASQPLDFDYLSQSTAA